MEDPRMSDNFRNNLGWEEEEELEEEEEEEDEEEDP
jgi:hypothetical protein